MWLTQGKIATLKANDFRLEKLLFFSKWFCCQLRNLLRKKNSNWNWKYRNKTDFDACTVTPRQHYSSWTKHTVQNNKLITHRSLWVHSDLTNNGPLNFAVVGPRENVFFCHFAYSSFARNPNKLRNSEDTLTTEKWSFWLNIASGLILIRKSHSLKRSNSQELIQYTNDLCLLWTSPWDQARHNICYLNENEWMIVRE